MLTEAGSRAANRLMGKALSTSDGKQFRATISRKGSLDLNSLLGNDPRACDVMELAKAGAPKFKSQDKVTDVATKEKWTVLKPMFDGPDYVVRYEVEKNI